MTAKHPIEAAPPTLPVYQPPKKREPAVIPPGIAPPKQSKGPLTGLLKQMMKLRTPKPKLAKLRRSIPKVRKTKPKKSQKFY